jgi:hypothetical protein
LLSHFILYLFRDKDLASYRVFKYFKLSAMLLYSLPYCNDSAQVTKIFYSELFFADYTVIQIFNTA